jgi:hypothetical protein
MFAAAGLNNLPELRDLRDVFYERYGSSLELFVNQEVIPCRSFPCTQFISIALNN